MHIIDWLIMTLPLLICGCIAIYTRRFVRGVADFMAGGRGAGRFLICTARSEQGSGAAVFVAAFQGFLVSGFTTRWWGVIATPASMLVMVTGYVIYRYRQTRAMTLGQFFEMRYSRGFRLFAGMLGFFAGIVNFGIIPAVGARFMVAFLNWPQKIPIMGLNVPTYLLLMGLFLTICVIMTTTAGQVSVLLTDCAEGMFSQLFYLFIAIALLIFVFDWSITKHVLLDTVPGKSLVSPFDSSGFEDFNMWYVLIGIIGGTFYRTIAWQNSHAFNASAASPHEARMGSVLGHWRNFAAGVMVTLLSVCALTYFNTHKTEIDAAMAGVTDPSVRSQMEAPLALMMMLPVGVKGMLLSIALMGIIAGDGIHLHSWGSIFVQDVVMPLRKTPLSPKQHITLLRLGVCLVAFWAFMFGWLVPQIKYVQFWWGITEAIFVGGAGVCIIAGLYWSKGTTAAAWTALVVGSLGAMTGLGTTFYYERILEQKWYIHVLGHTFHMNIPFVAFYNMLLATTVYIVVSHLTCRERHNMDKLLHRGAYAVEPESNVDAVAHHMPPPTDDDVQLDPAHLPKKPNWAYRIMTFGIDEQFSRSDRWITIGITCWSMFWFFVFIVGTVWNLIHRWSNETWAYYYLVTGVFLPLVIGALTTVWFTWGCTHDMLAFFRNLREEKIDVHDDGSVQHEEELRAFPAMPVAQPAAGTPATAAAPARCPDRPT